MSSEELPDASPELAVVGCRAFEPGPDGRPVLGPRLVVEVADGVITAVGPERPTAAGEVIDAAGLVAVPGFVNGHTHAAMTLLRGVAEDVDLVTWFDERIWPMEVNVGPHDVYLGTLLASAEMIAAGVTTFVDHYFFMEEAARAVTDAGIRANLGAAFFSDQGAEGLERSVAFARGLAGAAAGRITTSLAPHAPYTCTEDDLVAAADAARGLGVRVHLHAAENTRQTEASLVAHGLTPIAVLDRCGVLDAGAIIAHGNGIVDDDLPLLAEHADRVGVIHCPKTYLKYAMGTLTPIRALRAAGVPVGLGTDGAASNSTLDVGESLRLTAMTQKHSTGDATWFDLGVALDTAFASSAAAVGMGGELGALVPGHRADLALVDLDGPHCQPLHDPAAAFVYSARASDVRTTIVDGRVLMRDRELLTIDLPALLAEVRDRAAAITDRSHGRRIQSYAP